MIRVKSTMAMSLGGTTGLEGPATSIKVVVYRRSPEQLT